MERIELALRCESSYFYFSEGTQLINPGVPTVGGMITASPGKLQLQVPWRARTARIKVETYRREPAVLLDDYDDAIEFGYWSATGDAAVLDSSRTLVHDLGRLPIGAGDYRFRYHVREFDATPSSPGEARMLLQIWPDFLGAMEELKITGRHGNFWHPGQMLLKSLEI
ncbi:hypothetical protein GCM10027598_58710 [Amycolatopsis oliviviridis]|uniref:Uncharacterized protein n=1 Tax=Amycolatopsis oliviviridis TaxID=1471590 RepID=A0ABQ3LX39_9PSEU|nr:hypothetical protein [Amycolatopsis oliviviridis]GHH28468.1 hypothetical protein GCM10017790_59360 [Amycolatopsis oliviviridis]